MVVVVLCAFVMEARYPELGHISSTMFLFKYGFLYHLFWVF